MPASLIKFSPAAFEPKVPSTMHWGSAVLAEWQQNMSNPFFCGPRSSLGIWATLLCGLCCLCLDKFVGILSVHFSHGPSLVKAPHPRDQHSHNIRMQKLGSFGMQQLQVNPFGDALDTLGTFIVLNQFGG